MCSLRGAGEVGDGPVVTGGVDDDLVARVCHGCVVSARAAGAVVPGGAAVVVVHVDEVVELVFGEPGWLTAEGDVARAGGGVVDGVPVCDDTDEVLGDVEEVDGVGDVLDDDCCHAFSFVKDRDNPQ